MKSLRNLINVILPVFVFNMAAIAQCPLSVSTNPVCRNNMVWFSIPSGYTYSAIKWYFGDGDSSKQYVNNITHTYDTFGVFTARVITYNSNMTIKCQDSLKITVWDNPYASFSIPSQATQCFKGNHFCFKNTSTPGKFNGAPLVDFLWDFGNGDTGMSANPCYSYNTSGKYSIFLKVKDTNGCWDTAMRVTSIEVLPDLSPRFTTSYKISCPATTVKFNNSTTTTGKCITYFYWNFGDGTWDSSQANWTNFNHTYTKDGSFNPKLIVISCYNCIDSFTLPSGGRNICYSFNIDRTPGSSSVCWEGNNICFSQTPRKLAYYWLWTFNDPNSPPPEQTNNEDWAPCHSYSRPGQYDITLKIWEPNCIRDTTICMFTTLNGPMAMIKTPPPPAFPLNTCLRGKPVSVFDFAWINSNCNFPVDATRNKITTIRYVTIQKVPKYVSGTRKYYCNAIVISQDTLFQPSLCPGYPPTIIKINYRLNPSAIKTEDVYDSITLSAPQVWTKGDPIPTNIGQQYYYDNTGFPCNNQTMNENEIYKYNCQGPNLVRFTNNTYKYRLRYDIDNDPTVYSSYNTNPPSASAPPALQEFDRCFNKSFPWASDSLQYFWDFGDAYATGCTSTKAVPNMKCRYSTEIQPWHLYQNSGCFSALLTVTDTVTKCQSTDQVQIVMEAPNAGWDKKITQHLDWQTQMTVPVSSGKRGLRVNGTPCMGINYDQTLDMSQTSPSCGRQSWWVLFDSAQDCSTTCRDTTYIDYDSDGFAEPFPVSVISCSWIDQSTWAMMGNKYNYNDGGCKTIGFIIKTGDCTDTFFYHNYKYIADLNGSFNILNPDSFDVTKGIYTAHLNYQNNQQLRLCPSFQAILTVEDTTQEGITHFGWTISKFYGASWTKPVNISGECKDVKEKTYELCHRDSFIFNPLTGKVVYTYCFMYPGFDKNCYRNSVGNTPIDTFIKRRFFRKDSFNILNLKDTVLMIDSMGNSMWQPGKYNITSEIRNAWGCNTIATTEVYVGYYSDFTANDQISCFKPGGTSVVFSGNVRYFQPVFTPLDPDLNPVPFWKDPIGYRKGIPPVAPSVPEHLEWDLDGDGIFETPSVTGHDSVAFRYNMPGDYTIRMRTTDSNKCTQVLERKDFIKIIDFVADFEIDQLSGPCAPRTVKFNDKSYGLFTKIYTYDAFGNKTGSLTIDSVISWEWNFGDNRGSQSTSYLRNPVHTYINNGNFDVRLIVRTARGCVDTVIKKNHIQLSGPEPYFRIVGDTIGCVPFYLTVKDSSKNVQKWDFVLGNGNHKIFNSRFLDSVFWLPYTLKGTYNLYLTATAAVWNSTTASWEQCSSTFGESSDQYDPHFRVICDQDPPRPVINVYHDTLLVTGPASHYQWYRNFYEIPGSDNDSLVIHQTGMYMVKVFHYTGCSNFSDTLVILSVPGLEHIDLMIFPNPVRENLIVAGKIKGPLSNVSIRIYNSTGQVVYFKSLPKVAEINENISMNRLPAGIYLLEIESRDSKGLVKVMKE